MSKFLYTLTPKQKYLFVECSGENRSLEELMRFAHDIVEASEKGKFVKVLMDSRWLKVKVSMFTKYQYADNLMDIPFVSKFRIAVAAGETHWQQQKDLELFLNNRSLPMFKIFKTLADAEEWLIKIG